MPALQNKRFFDHDPMMGITRYFYHDEETGESTIETVQDVTAIGELNKAKYDAHTSLDRWGDGKIVASIPMSVYAKMLREGKTNDQAYMRRWLNDPENRMYRVRPGKV